MPDGSPDSAPRAALLGWGLLATFLALTFFSIVVGKAALLRLGYPAAAVAAGVVLIRWYPALYVGFVWWLWFLTPLVRRLVDYQAGWDPTNPVLLAPLLVTALSAHSVIGRLGAFRRRALAPIALVLAGILYAYPVGIVRAGLSAATYSLLLWIVPPCFGFHLAARPERCEAFRKATQHAFWTGVLVLGAYGIWQYFAPPGWDQYWMVKSGMRSIGMPEPRLVRVFSTLNSPVPFALVLVAGLFTLQTARLGLQWGAGVPGYIALLLSLVRTAWLGWLIGFLTYVAFSTRRTRRRLVPIVAGLTLMLIPFMASEVGETVVMSRFQSLGEMGEDVSFRARVAFYRDLLDYVLERPLGEGLGSTGSGVALADANKWRIFDSGVLDLVVSLGWPGAALYVVGLVTLAPVVMRRAAGSDPRFPNAARAIAITLLACMLSLNTLIGVLGVVFWGFVGLFLAGRAEVSHHSPGPHASSHA